MNSKVKYEQNNDELKFDNSTLECDLKILKKNFKAKEKELHATRKENETLKDNIEQVRSELKELSAKVKKFEKSELKNSKVVPIKDFQPTMNIPCEICSKQFESFVKLKVHIKLDHFVNNYTQTDTVLYEAKEAQTKPKVNIDIYAQETKFESYSCFYCDRKVENEVHLLEHQVTCQGATETPSLFSYAIRSRALLYECAVCGLVGSCKEEMINHKKRVHGNE